MRPRNRAILSDIANLGLDPTKKYVKVNKTGNLVAEPPKGKVVLQEQSKQQQKKVDVVEVHVEQPVIESLKVEEKEEVTSIEIDVVELTEVTVEETPVKTESLNKLPFKKKKK